MLCDMELKRINELIQHREEQISAKINTLNSFELTDYEQRQLSDRMKAIFERAQQLTPEKRLDFHKETLKQLSQDNSSGLDGFKSVIQTREKQLLSLFPAIAPFPSVPLLPQASTKSSIENGICCSLY